MEALFARLVEELERPRPLGAQVIWHLTDHHDLAREDIGRFLDEQLPTLEEGDLDLLLSPLFTPKLTDQARIAEVLQDRALPDGEWPDWIRRLHQRPTLGQLLDDGGQAHRFALQPVTLERFVHRLRLDGSVGPEIAGLIRHLFTEPARPLLFAVARRAIWNTSARVEVLRRQLSAPHEAGIVKADALALLQLMETAEPEDAADILGRIPAWTDTLRQQIAEAGQPKMFFNEQVRYLHGGGRDQRNPAPDANVTRQAELEFLRRLRTVLAA